ncbi:MAG: flagellar biosynthesis protein FlhB [Nitrospirota bacterium]
MAGFEERTEQATPRRQQKAKEKGQVARSRELISMSATGGIILMFYFSGSSFIVNMSELMRKLLNLQYGSNPAFAMRFAASEMFWILFPFLGIAFAFAVLTGVLQGGFILKPLSLETERLNPINGFKRLFSRYGIVEFLKSLLKFAVGGFIFYLIIKSLIAILPFTQAMDIREIMRVSGRLLFKAVIIIFMTFFIFAVMDYLYERWRFERSLKMTKHEVKEEYKETEGDPLVKSRVKSIQRELARRRMMQEVPKATVVITNPTHIAVALKYKKEEMSAPMVIAKGAGFVAEKIKEIARKNHIPIVEDKPLARALYKLNLDSFIPVDLYRAVAKILAYIYNVRGVA